MPGVLRREVYLMLNLDVGVRSEVVSVVTTNPPRVVDVFPGIADEGKLPRNFGYRRNEFHLYIGTCIVGLALKALNV